MKIKNFLVEQIDYVIDEVERILCLEGISYVKVDNEIHCPNLVIRFYDIANRLVINEIIKKNLNNSRDKEGSVFVISTYKEPEEITGFSPKKENKAKILKQQNQMYNKNYKRRF